MAIADLVVRGGLVVDGTGEDPRRADVAVSGGRIASIGSDLTGRRVVDAAGALVVPGFIDIHTHYDPQATWDPWLTPSSHLGVTSVVAGNCGFSVAPCRPADRSLMLRTLEAVEDMSYDAMDTAIPWSFETYPEYLRQLRGDRLGLNFGGYVGHTAVRMWVMGQAAYEREATQEEIDAMCAVVREAVLGGALGFSTDRAGFLQGADGRPVPSVVASWDETEQLCLAVRDAGRGIVHVAPGNDLANVEWIYDFAPRFGRTITWSAILAFPEGSGQVDWRDKLGVHQRHPGMDVHPQVTSRALTFHWGLENPLTLYRYPAFADLVGLPPNQLLDRFTSESFRSQARAELAANPPDWTRTMVVESGQSTAVDHSVGELAATHGVTPIDALLDLAVADRLSTRVSVVAANLDDRAVATLLTGEGCILGLSDAGAHIGQLCDSVMPVHFLSEWVRDRDLLPLAAGVRKTSGEIADVLGMTDRGYLREGDFADLAVIEWEQLATGPIRRVADLPGGGDRLVADEPTGLRHVLVNGEPIRVDHQSIHAENRAGQMLQPKSYR